MKAIDRNTMKPGDTVGVPRKVYIGWGTFRYVKIVPMKVQRITPAKTKIVMENGVEYDRYQKFYELDEDAKNQTYVAECAERLNDALYELQGFKLQGKLFTMKDDTIVALSESMDKVMEVLKCQS